MEELCWKFVSKALKERMAFDVLREWRSLSLWITCYNLMGWITISPLQCRNSPILTQYHRLGCPRINSAACRSKELKSKLSVAYIFGLGGLVRLFYLSHFFVSSSSIYLFWPRRHRTWLQHSYIWTRAWKGRGSCSTKLHLGLPEHWNTALAAAARCLPQLVLFLPHGSPADLRRIRTLEQQRKTEKPEKKTVW